MLVIRARLAPLLVRPGARFTCHENGFCCTDMHLLRPVTAAEARRLEAFRSGVTGVDLKPRVRYLRTLEDGRCALLDEDGHCEVHREAGAMAKPRICRRFPFGIVATPSGARLTTSHRCPCRTVGQRKVLEAADAESVLRDGQGRLLINGAVDERVPWTRRTSVSFATYERAEARMITRLLAGADPLEVFEQENGLPALRGESWLDLARSLRAADALGAPGCGLAWWGYGILLLLGEAGEPPARPWKERIELVAQTQPQVGTADEVIGDWLADGLWELGWVAFGGFDVGRAELGVRCQVVRRLVRFWVEAGVRGDVAAGEAVMIGDLACGSEKWRIAVPSLSFNRQEAEVVRP